MVIWMGVDMKKVSGQKSVVRRRDVHPVTLSRGGVGLLEGAHEEVMGVGRVRVGFVKANEPDDGGIQAGGFGPGGADLWVGLQDEEGMTPMTGPGRTREATPKRRGKQLEQDFECALPYSQRGRRFAAIVQGGGAEQGGVGVAVLPKPRQQPQTVRPVGLAQATVEGQAGGREQDFGGAIIQRPPGGQ